MCPRPPPSATFRLCTDGGWGLPAAACCATGRAESLGPSDEMRAGEALDSLTCVRLLLRKLGCCTSSLPGVLRKPLAEDGDEGVGVVRAAAMAPLLRDSGRAALASSGGDILVEVTSPSAWCMVCTLGRVPATRRP